MKKRQKTSTFNNGAKIKVVVTPRSSVGNHIGFSAIVTHVQTGETMRLPILHVLTENEALFAALGRFCSRPFEVGELVQSWKDGKKYRVTLNMDETISMESDDATCLTKKTSVSRVAE